MHRCCAEGGDLVARPHRPRGLLRVGLDDPRALENESQDDAFVARIGRDVEGGRSGIVAGNRERGAVRQDTLGGIEAELAKRERGIVDRHRDEAPGVADGRCEPLAQLVFGIAIVLLEVLGLEEHPLGPDHLVVPGHSDSREL